MIRRSFIKSLSLSLFAPLLQWKTLLGWLGESKVLHDGVKEIIAINNCDTIQLHWENPIPLLDAPQPKWSWREFLTNACGYDEDELTNGNLEEEWSLSQSALDKPCEHILFDEWWGRNALDTTSQVFHYLEFFEFSDDLKERVDFVEFPNPCSNYVGVEVPDVETLWALQKELNEGGENIKFNLIEDWDELD
jgi:hypothetical protein